MPAELFLGQGALHEPDHVVEMLIQVQLLGLVHGVRLAADDQVGD
jgi:hypothetical protein